MYLKCHIKKDAKHKKAAQRKERNCSILLGRVKKDEIQKDIAEISTE